MNRTQEEGAAAEFVAVVAREAASMRRSMVARQGLLCLEPPFLRVRKYTGIVLAKTNSFPGGPHV